MYNVAICCSNDTTQWETFEGENFRELVKNTIFVDATLPNFTKKTFMNSHKTVKFTKVFCCTVGSRLRSPDVITASPDFWGSGYRLVCYLAHLVHLHRSHCALPGLHELASKRILLKYSHQLALGERGMKSHTQAYVRSEEKWSVLTDLLFFMASAISLKFSASLSTCE